LPEAAAARASTAAGDSGAIDAKGVATLAVDASRGGVTDGAGVIAGGGAFVVGRDEALGAVGVDEHAAISVAAIAAVIGSATHLCACRHRTPDRIASPVRRRTQPQRI